MTVIAKLDLLEDDDNLRVLTSCTSVKTSQ